MNKDPDCSSSPSWPRPDKTKPSSTETYLRLILFYDSVGREDRREADGDSLGAAIALRSGSIFPNALSQFLQKSSLRADSLLARLSDEDYEAGMTRLKAHAATAETDETVVEDIDLFVFRK